MVDFRINRTLWIGEVRKHRIWSSTPQNLAYRVRESVYLFFKFTIVYESYKNGDVSL